MKNWEDDDDEQHCSTRQDLVDVAAVADVLEIELEAVNFAAEYKDRVFASFLAEYAAGRTPNPDVLCNAEIKFKAFLDHALAMGAAAIATGHYAGVRRTARRLRAAERRRPGEGSELLPPPPHAGAARPGLLSARRTEKDGGAPDRPRGGARRACQEGLDRDLLHRRAAVPRVPEPLSAARTPAPCAHPKAAMVGEHIGLAFYTLGQRSGLGIGGKRGGEAAPWYVAGKDRERNELVVVQGRDHPLLRSRALAAADLAWVGGEPPEPAVTYGGKTRYRQADAPCHIAEFDAGECADRLPRPAMGRHARAVGGVVPGRGVPRRGRDPVVV